MDPSRSHRIIRVINNCEGPRLIQKKIETFLSCYYLSFIKFLINIREIQELPGVEHGTSGLQMCGCPTEPYTPYNLVHGHMDDAASIFETRKNSEISLNQNSSFKCRSISYLKYFEI